MSRPVCGRSQRQAETLQLFASPGCPRDGSELAQVGAARAGRGPTTPGRGVQAARGRGVQTAASRKARTVATRHGAWRDYVEETLSASAPVYTSARLDLAHQLAALNKFADHPFVTNGHGEVVCPVCSVGLLCAEDREHFPRHFVCSRSGLVFYGDEESLALCQHPAEDVASRLCPAAV